MNQAQHDYLYAQVRHEFEQVGYRGGLHQAPQIEAAVGIVGKALKANASVPADYAGTPVAYYIHQAVAHVRTGKLTNVPDGARTATPCKCGKPKSPHLASLHG